MAIADNLPTRQQLLIDDMLGPELGSCLGTRWSVVTDGVMGGVSSASLSGVEREGRRCLHLRGFVNTANNGGFVQAALDLDSDGGWRDLSEFDALEFDVFGNGEAYNLHLRTAHLTLPWQSFRASFIAPSSWTRTHIPFDSLKPHRTEAAFDPRRVRRLGLVGIGRDFRADLAFSMLRLVRHA